MAASQNIQVKTACFPEHATIGMVLNFYWSKCSQMSYNRSQYEYSPFCPASATGRGSVWRLPPADPRAAVVAAGRNVLRSRDRAADGCARRLPAPGIEAPDRCWLALAHCDGQ